MKLNSLKLRGFTGIKKGMGLDELELDLSGLSGLIAFSGQNGSGKTTVLESLQPYRTLASRKGTLANHVFLRDACKELDFDFQGNRYQTKVLVDCDSGKQEGYIWQNGEPVVDGKARSYDAYIEALFGSRDLFFNSIFYAQNASKLSDLTTGKLKELFAEFLRLDQYIAYEQATKRCISLLMSQGSIYESQIDNLKDRLQAFGDLENQKNEVLIALQRADDDREQCQQALAKIDGMIEELKGAVANNQALETRAGDFRERINATRDNIGKAEKAYETQAEELRSQIRELNAEIKNMASILENEDLITQAVSRKKDLETKVEDLRKYIDVGYAKRDKLMSHDSEIDDSLRHLEPHPRERELPILATRIEGLKQSTKALDTRDPACESTVCGFISGALAAQDKLPELEKELADLTQAVEAHNAENEKRRTELQAEKNALSKQISETVTALDQNRGKLDRLKRELLKVSELADAQADLREALTKKAHAEKRKEELTAQGMELKAAHDEQVKQWDVELRGLRENLQGIEKQIDHDAGKRLAELQEEISGEESSLKTFEATIKDLEAKIRTIENQQAEKGTLQNELASIETAAKKINTQVSEWTYLRNALSANGIRALEIDAVAPSISAYANQILFNTFGPGYTVKLRTQDDEGREVLDILALEPDGRETMLDDLSGGEKVYALKALRLALTLLAKQKSRKDLMTAFSDEEDGALDPSNAENFIHMYRAFMEAGGFDSCFFISHRESCVAMADHTLHFNSGGVEIA